MRRITAAAVVAAALSSACVQNGAAPKAGLQPDGDFRIVESDKTRLVVEAGDRRIAIAPPEGLCVDGDAAMEEDGALVVMVGACVGGQKPEAITTITLGDEALIVGEDRDAAFTQLAAFLGTEAGREGVGVGGAAEDIRILDTKRTDDTLFVLVEDRSANVAEALGARFWRAFTEINGRAAIASRAVLAASPEADAASLLRLSGIMSAIKKATRDESGADAAGATG